MNYLPCMVQLVDKDASLIVGSVAFKRHTLRSRARTLKAALFSKDSPSYAYIVVPDGDGEVEIKARIRLGLNEILSISKTLDTAPDAEV